MTGGATLPPEVGRYRPIRILGRGGMGVVYLAYDPRLDRQVALKVITPALAADPEVRRRFLDEARLAARIDHPHIVPVYEAGEDDGVLYLVMQVIEGSDLRTRLLREGVMTPEQTVAIAGQVASALDAAHARGLVHRDVKPGNILITAGPVGLHAYLSDFGLTGHSDTTVGLVAEGTTAGTVDYLAPEQIEGGSVDARADVYALGCVVYQCLTGSPPFVGSEAAVLASHMNDPPPPIPGGPPLDRLSAVVARALAKDPVDRQPSAGAFADDLRTAVDGPARAAVGGPADGLRSRRSILAVAVFLCVIAVALGAGILWDAISKTPTDASLSDTTQVLGTHRMVIAAGAGSAYVGKINFHDGALIRYGTTPGPREGTVVLPYMPLGVVVADSRVWVVTATSPTDTSTELVDMPLTHGPAPKQGLTLSGSLTCLQYPAASCNPVLGAKSIWVPVGSTLYRVDPETRRVIDRIPMDDSITSVTFGGGWVWVLLSKTLERIDVDTGKVEPVPLPGLATDLRPARIAYAGDRVWIVCFGTDPSRNELVRVDFNLPTPGIGATISYPDASSVTAARDGIWVGTSATPSTVRRLDPQTGQPTSDPVKQRASVTGLAPLPHGALVLTYEPSTKVRRLAWAEPPR